MTLMPNREFIATKCVCCNSRNITASPAMLMPFVAHRAFGWKPQTIDGSWELSTVQHGNAYSLCNSLLCIDCSTIFLDIRFDDGSLRRLYNEYRGKEYVEMREKYEPGYSTRNFELLSGIKYKPEVEKFLIQLIPPEPSVLDWGGDTGINTPFTDSALSIDVYDISGVEIISHTNAKVKTAGFTETAGKVYDLVVCSNVLEHVPYPEDVLNLLKPYLGKNSILYIEVPWEKIMHQYEDPKRRLSAKRHWHEHINFFSLAGLTSLCKKCGLEVLKKNFLAIEAGHHPTLLQFACKLSIQS
jgi:hypothetical protein